MSVAKVDPFISRDMPSGFSDFFYFFLVHLSHLRQFIFFFFNLFSKVSAPPGAWSQDKPNHELCTSFYFGKSSSYLFNKRVDTGWFGSAFVCASVLLMFKMTNLVATKLIKLSSFIPLHWLRHYMSLRFRANVLVNSLTTSMVLFAGALNSIIISLACLSSHYVSRHAQMFLCGRWACRGYSLIPMHDVLWLTRELQREGRFTDTLILTHILFYYKVFSIKCNE